MEGVGNKWSNHGVGRETRGRETSKGVIEAEVEGEGVTEANIVWPTMHQDLLEYISSQIIFKASMNPQLQGSEL